MTGNRKRKKRKSERHVAAYHRGIVSTPIRRAFEALMQGGFRTGNCRAYPSTSELVARLTSGRASRVTVRSWCNGARRAPRWFVQVLRFELGEQVREREDMLAQLAEYRPLDRGRSKANRAARARAQIMAGIGAIGRRKRAHGAINEDTPSENDPHN